MSGPGLDFLEYRLQELAHMITFRGTCPEHRAFAKHLLKCYDAALMLGKILDGVDSPGDEIRLIRAVLAPHDILDQTIDEAHIAADNLRKELERACGRAPVRPAPPSFT
jgi:glutamate mutase epsilon subunit